ncbi:MAG: acyltransferase family protein [Sphingobium sp.]
MEDRGHGAPAQAKAEQRLDWIDIARGIGIVAVVIGHVWTRGPLRDAMYSFHMPLFFLLSGLLSKPQPVGRFAWRQLTGQMRPYCAFLVLLILIDQIVEPMKGGRPIFHNWPADLWPILLGGSWLRGPYTIFWFVPCLMVARILYNLAPARWPDPRAWAWWIVAPAALLLAYGMGAATDVSPLGLLTVPMALVLLWIGALWRAVEWRGWMLAPLVPLAVAGLLLMPTLNMKAGDYGWPILSIGSAIATSLLILQLARWMAPYAGWLGVLGRASLVIMYCHVALIHYLSPYVGKVWLLGIALLVPFGLYHLLRVTPLRRIFL